MYQTVSNNDNEYYIQFTFNVYIEYNEVWLPSSTVMVEPGTPWYQSQTSNNRGGMNGLDGTKTWELPSTWRLGYQVRQVVFGTCLFENT